MQENNNSALYRVLKLISLMHAWEKAQNTAGDRFMKMYQVDAFTTALFKGNPAAVIVVEDWLDDALIQPLLSLMWVRSQMNGSKALL